MNYVYSSSHNIRFPCSSLIACISNWNIFIMFTFRFQNKQWAYVLICFDCHFTIIRCHKMALKIGLFWAWHINRLMLLIFISLWIVFNRSQLKYLWSQTKRSHTKVNQIKYSYRMRYALSYQFVVNEAYCLGAGPNVLNTTSVQF